MHEQSETIQRPDGKWINVYGRKLPKAGQQLPGTMAYDSMGEAVADAKARSESFDDHKPVRWSDEALGEAGPGTVWMSPDDYLKLSPKMEKKPWESAKGKDLRGSIDAGEEVYETPSLTLKKGRVTAQDGRHRALAAKEAGIKMIPVKIAGDPVEGEAEVVGMQGNKVKLSAPPRAWDDVARDPEFRKLPSEERQAARRAYFDEVVAPRLSATDVETARGEFEAETRPRRAPKEMRGFEEFADPTAGMGAGERFVAGYGKAGADIARGTGKLVRDVAELVPGGERVADVAGLPTAEDVASARQRDAPLMSPEEVLSPIQSGRLGIHPNALRQERTLPSAAAIGNVVGNAAAAAPLAVAPGANTLLGSAAYGAGYGAIQPAEDWSERGRNALLAGGVSSAVTGGVRAAPALYRSFVSPLTASGREGMALDTIGRFAKDPNALRTWSTRPAPPGAPAIDELVPGSRATLAEVTGDPGIAQAQRAAQAASPDVANDLATSRTARLEARKNALLKNFGIENQKALKATRDSIAERLYRKAWEEPIDPVKAKALSPDIKSLLARPSIQRARANAYEIALEEGEILRPKDITGAGSVKGLHYTKKGLDKEITAAKNANDFDGARRLENTRDKLLNVVDELSPAYKAARIEYAKASKPLNQAQIGEYLQNKLVPALTQYGAERLTPQAFAKALREGNAMAKRATGFSGAKLKDILDTNQWNTLVNLAKDVAREAGAAERGRVPGSPTAQYLAGRNVLRQMLGPIGLPETWSEKIAADLLANKWTTMIASPVERDVQNRLATMLSDPRQAAAAQARVDARRGGVLPRTANALTRHALPVASATAGVESIEGREGGGPVEPGRPYVVGEAGPEVIVPRNSGTVMPNALLAQADPLTPQAKLRYLQAVGAPIDPRPENALLLPRADQGVLPIPPNVAGLARLLVQTGRARNAAEAIRMAQGMTRR